MKFVLAFLITSSAFAADQFAPVSIDWNGKYLSETVVLMCDDSFYQGVSIEMPGTFKESYGEVPPTDFMTLKNCGAEWKITKKEHFVKDGKPFMRVRMKGSSACEVEIRSYPSSGKKIFDLTIGDAC